MKTTNHSLYIVKAGGDVLENSPTIIWDIQKLASSGADVILVYGAQSALSRKMEENGMKPEFINGLRVTDYKTMKQVFIPAIVERGEELANQFSNAQVIHGGVYAKRDWNLGYVGHPTHVDRSIKGAITHGKVVIVSPLAKSDKPFYGFGEYNYLNCNADSVASQLALYLAPSALYFATNVNGLLYDGMHIPAIDVNGVRCLVNDGAVNGGMVPKVKSAAAVASKGIETVIFNGISPTGGLARAMQGCEGTIIYS